ncbi:MAG TPA: glycosyltransferase [Caulobacteraceae bacterium]|jgi:glycosyltransferase involved in cell wall biosynthesis|nr:glycosyltransferase [Caulobacteraceae bacterium]
MADSGLGGFATMLTRWLKRARYFRRWRRERAVIIGSGLFDAGWYVAANPDVAAAGADPVEHYVRAGAAEGRRPSPWFDSDWYLARNADVAGLGLNPLAHYILFGAAEGRDPNAVFSGLWYLTNNPDAQREVTPLSHYVRVGAAAMRDPSADLDARWYAERNPDAAAAGLDPLAHYLLIGRKEGRRSSPYGELGQAGAPVTAARLETFKTLGPVAGRTVALFVAHAPDGGLKPNVGPYVEALVEAGVEVVLIAAADRPFAIEPALAARLTGGFVRENLGYDFAAWAHVMRAEPALFSAETLLILNDSLIGPSSVAALSALLDQVRASSADVVGATDSREHGWHLQSFFVAFKRRALSSVAMQGFFGAVRCLDDKDQVIRAYEVRLAAALRGGGLTCEALFPSADGVNQTLFHWRGLIDAGFPFVKTLTLRRGDEPGVDISGWRETLAAHGFDLATVDATLGSPVRPSTPSSLRSPLLKAPTRAAVSTEPWKVAFIGPWNYGSGLGEASRGYLSALWRAGVRLNLHPVEGPFNLHARFNPSVSLNEFEGPADVAIVHLNPDAWQLLGEAERAVIDRARRRAGLWVWEMGHLPKSWSPNFGKVDAVWAPSRYCADIFAAGGAARVEVIPHVVPVGPPPDASARAQSLGRFGLPADARVVLYTFDGSSYLVRKNPEALVRAFAASGLADEGWRLVLKTKHLMYRPAEGRALMALVGANPAVRLIDQRLSREEMAALFAAADIYASPHRSEGFGLTIAEAMAMGKSVVASDFGGSRDFLDDSCGYPVPVRVVKLDRDHGHYTRGGVWGEVDEAAFAEALRAAARRLSAGDHAIGSRARARVAERLSAAAVGQALKTALDAMSALPSRAEAA